MQHTYILSLIDAHLDRLIKARQILATLDTARARPQPPAPRSLAPRSLAVPKALKTAGRKIPSSGSALQAERQEISPRKKATTATMAQTPSESNRAAAALAQVPENTVLKPASVADAQIRLDGHQGQAARKASKSADRETAPHLVVKVQTRRRRLVPKSLSSEPPARALGGSVPAAPIFIPAGQVFQERLQRQVESASEGIPSGSTASVPLTAELLARRWVQGLAS
jgi:hypothetical protein